MQIVSSNLERLSAHLYQARSSVAEELWAAVGTGSVKPAERVDRGDHRIAIASP